MPSKVSRKIAYLILCTWMTCAAATKTPAESSRISIPKPAPLMSSEDHEDVDRLITNPKMRAETGSKSRFSLSSSLFYSGGSLNQPFGERKPNISGAPGTTDFPSLGGTVAGKLNINARHSLFGGVGVRWVAPLSLHRPTDYSGNIFDADTPYLTYQYLYRLGGLQSSLQLRESWTTTSDLRRLGYVTSWGISQYSVYEFGASGLSAGFNTWIGLGYFDRDELQYKALQSDYSWALAPFLEYRLSDRLNLRLDTNLFVYDHMRSMGNALTFRRQSVTQILSLGWSVTRDIFISPGISLSLERLSLARTTWSVSSSVNLF